MMNNPFGFENFIGMITDAIYSYATSEGIEGVNEEYCYKLVLGYHQYTEAFQNLSIQQQIEYSQITVNEQEENENSKGAHAPIGHGECN